MSTEIQEVPTNLMTVEMLKAAMPKRQKSNITQELVDQLNSICTDESEREHFRDNLVGYSHALIDPHVCLPDYINAVRYVGFKQMGLSNQQAWMKTFPDRYQRLVDEGKISEEDTSFLRATVSCYRRGKLVVSILNQSMIPTHILNQDIYQQAVNQLAHLMFSAKSEKVRSDSAKALMDNLKMPDTAKLQIDMNVKEDDSLKQLRQAITELATTQRQQIEAGLASADEIAGSKLINGECERVDD